MTEQMSGGRIGDAHTSGSESQSGREHDFVIERLGWRATMAEIITAIAAALGLTLLWGLENVRNAFFRLLDRLNLKPRGRDGIAFPPGRPRKLKH